MRWTTRFVRISLGRGAGLKGKWSTLMQEAVEAFHRSNARLTFDKILKGLSRQNIANKLMERVAGEEVV